jgi:hypothetical protein
MRKESPAPERLERSMAAGTRFEGLTETFVFDSAGNTLGEVHLLQLATFTRSPAP